MFGTWNFIDAGLRKNSFGHQYSETRALAGELLRRGMGVRILSCSDAPPPWLPGIEVVPAFSLFGYQPVSDDPSWSALENFIVHNRAFDRDLSRLGQAPFRGTLCMFPTMDVWHFMGALRWLGRFAPADRPKAAIVLFPLRDWSPDDVNARLYRTVWKECPDAARESAVLCVREAESANRFEKLLGVRPHLLPSPLGPIERRASARGQAADAPLIVTYVGGARPERGAGLIPEIVARAAAPGVRFFVQVKGATAPDYSPQLRDLGARSDVRLHEGLLEEDAYYAAIAEGLVLLPYRAEAYGIKSSGVYVEAKFMGAPVIVPEGSWMADEVRALGNGLVFEAYNAESVAECIARARRDIVNLRKVAAAAAEDFRAANGADRCVDAIAALFGGSV